MLGGGGGGAVDGWVKVMMMPQVLLMPQALQALEG